jgi:hypothetical protein
MSSFTFDFDLEDDLDESFDVITPQKPAAPSSVDKTLVPESAPAGAIPAEEIPLSTLVRDTFLLLYHLISSLQPILSGIGSAALRTPRSILIFAYNTPGACW